MFRDRLYKLIRSIQQQALFDHPVSAFELIETHISYILLTGSYAYKFKKPVNLGFLDFSSLEKRKYYCEEEIRLNRRLAPGIYLEVVTITGDDLHPQLSGAGTAIEYAVKMAQFSTADELEKVIEEGRLERRHIDLLADTIAVFHQEIACTNMDTRYGSPEIIRRYAMENFTHIRPALCRQENYRKLADRLEDWTGTELKRLHGVFLDRKRQGHVRECHGDLHAGNVALHQGMPVIFDCIEFNRELHWIDTMSEIAFLCMDLEARGLTESCWRFLNRYLELIGDYSGLSLFRFYLVYRALVRCKIACIRLGQSDLSRQGGVEELKHEHRYLDLADAYIHPREPRLIITHGLSGSGKTTITQILLEKFGAVRLRSDIERQRLFATPGSAGNTHKAGQGKYSEAGIRRVYQYLADITRSSLTAGFSVIVDATFLHADQRDMFRCIAFDGGYRFLILDCRAPQAQLRDRVVTRIQRSQDASEADLEILDYQIATRDPLSDIERKYSVVVENSGVVPDSTFLDHLLQELTDMPPPHSSMHSR